MSVKGFKAGIELHQQLDTETKLFCDCSTNKSEEFPENIKRRLRAVAGETGEVDASAEHEFEKEMEFVYKYNPKTTCLVELDSEPPHELNEEALNVTLEVTKLMHAEPVDEIEVMRKTVIDGSCVSGFQRTALIATDGFIETSEGKVGIDTIQLEEDAATTLEKKKGTKIFRLDRLGIPLIELATAPDIKNPEHLKETAERIGAFFRATGKAKRGIGTIRQDVNISIPEGARIEIKGAQELEALPKLARKEVKRQERLLEVKKELENIPKPDPEIVDVTEMFEDSDCNFLKSAEAVFACKLPGLDGMLGEELYEDHRVGTELSDYAKTAGVGGLIHSDEEVSEYGIKELPGLREKLKASEDDAIVFVGDKKTRARKGMQRAVDRVKKLFEGVPEETRKALEDNSTQYLRPLSGSTRLYPETDVPPIVITEKDFEEIKEPEKPEEVKERLRDLGLNDELVKKLAGSQKLFLFNRIQEKTNADPKTTATVLTETLVSLRRNGYEVKNINETQFIELFKTYSKGMIARESIEPVLKAATKKNKTLREIVAEKAEEQLTEEEVFEKVNEIIKANKEILEKDRPFPKIMGEVMQELKGKADGELISKVVRERIKEWKQKKTE